MIHSQITATHALLMRLFALPISRPLSRRWDGCLRGFAQENESISKLAREWLTDRGKQNHLFISIRKFVHSGRSVINCRLSCANYLSICTRGMTVDFAIAKPDPLAKHNPYEARSFTRRSYPRGFEKININFSKIIHKLNTSVGVYRNYYNNSQFIKIKRIYLDQTQKHFIIVPFPPSPPQAQDSYQPLKSIFLSHILIRILIQTLPDRK